MRVVLDTNVLLSACWKPGGLEGYVVQLVRSGQLQACVSAAMLAEYADVAARPKFAAHQACLAALVSDMRQSLFFVPAAIESQGSDADDHHFLACAVAAQAAWLITGNLRHFPESVQTTRVGNARTFLTAVSLLPSSA
jgi:uncharacterized protein